MSAAVTWGTRRPLIAKNRDERGTAHWHSSLACARATCPVRLFWTGEGLLGWWKAEHESLMAVVDRIPEDGWRQAALSGTTSL